MPLLCAYWTILVSDAAENSRAVRPGYDKRAIAKDDMW
jgi:hypothetical protein